MLDRREVPGDRIFIFDLARFAQFRERDVADPPGPLDIEITYYDEANVRDLVREERVPFDEAADEEAKVRLLQQRVYFNAVYPFEINVVHLGAARRIDIQDVDTEGRRAQQ